jgi:hypothetical protein
MRIRDPGWKNCGSGIPDPYIGFSLALVSSHACFMCSVRRFAGRVGELWLDASTGSLRMVPVVLQVAVLWNS